jgi:zinc transporter ZupT
MVFSLGRVMSKKEPVGIEIFGAAAKSSSVGSKTTSQNGGSKKGGSTSANADPETDRRTTRWLGVTAFVIAVVFSLVDGYAIGVAIGDNYELAVVLAVVAIVGTIIAFLLGAAALVLGRGRGRWWGFAAMVLSVVANPVTLVQILVFFSDFTAT